MAAGGLAALWYQANLRDFLPASQHGVAATWLVAAACGLVESLPIEEWDNLTVGAAGMLLSTLVL